MLGRAHGSRVLTVSQLPRLLHDATLLFDETLFFDAVLPRDPAVLRDIVLEFDKWLSLEMTLLPLETTLLPLDCILRLEA